MRKTFEKAVTGFNHNIRHRGILFHVQTEDSGINNPHVITHLFMGGNILASKKTSYADIRNAENLADVVRALMEEQHKEMLRNLVNGVYDDLDAMTKATHYQPGELAPAKAPAARAPAAPTGQKAKAKAAKAANAEPAFGEDVISERSLDEVILSYLAGKGES